MLSFRSFPQFYNTLASCELDIDADPTEAPWLHMQSCRRNLSNELLSSLPSPSRRSTCADILQVRNRSGKACARLVEPVHVKRMAPIIVEVETQQSKLSNHLIVTWRINY
jgi:hypothetical protein